MKRRSLLKAAAAVTAISPAAVDGEGALTIIDSNVSLFRWPFRRLPLDSTEKLVEKIHELGIGSAMAGSFEGVFQRDLSAVNARLAEECAKYPELHPIGSVNPTARDWKQDFFECVENHEMAGIRLHPGYHGYGLDHSSFAELVGMAVEADVVVQVAVSLEDTRTHNEFVRVPDVDVSKMPDPGNGRIQLLNWKPRGGIPPKVYFDTARIDGTDSLAKLLTTVSPHRILFGTHAPLLIPEAALIRAVHENQLSEDPMGRILAENAARLFSR